MLEALARALRLNLDETAYLFDLAQQRLPYCDKPATVPAATLVMLVEDLAPLPAMLVDHRYDILAWNREMSRLLLDIDALAPARRNTMWMCLMHPGMREFYLDRDQIIREGVADLRAAWAAHPDDGALAQMVADFTARSPEFAKAWAEHDVKVRGRGRKRLNHPVAGVITVDFEVLMPLQETDQRLIVYRAADAASQQGLDRLTLDALDVDRLPALQAAHAAVAGRQPVATTGDGGTAPVAIERSA
ncbi:transcriptional regulator [Nocardia cyriacigeorgica]|uniref:MmyB family transcriptional regulator n=1 Tax=Nocardia cyriacigeorgica TaxID=135487 RepID=UPI002458688D|nr:transcriptional regulator [Nocardia cyriacigeorgica]